jgi:hypothetical protein
VRGRLWRTSNPGLAERDRQALVDRLMAARRAVGAALRASDPKALASARAEVDAAKIGLGERGPVWWPDGAPDLNRHLARTTPYATWFAAQAPDLADALPAGTPAAGPRSHGEGGPAMPKTTPCQRKTIGRVMHEYEHGELKSGPDGAAGKVKSRKQAIAIALSEAGASTRESASENKRSFAKTKAKEAHGQTAQQAREGKAHVGADGQRESTPAMGGKNATRTTARGRKAANARARTGPTKAELYARARTKGVAGRSKMTK